MAEEVKRKLESIYLLILELGVYITLFTPLVLNKNYFFPYVVPKTIFFRVMVDILLIVYVLLVISKPRYLPKLNPLTAALAVFLLISIISSFTGVNFLRSFWSTFERMTGLLTLIHLFIFFIILTSVFRERKYWERILIVSILVGVILSFYIFFSEDPTARGAGTIGNTSFMSAYLIFDIFFAAVFFFTKLNAWRIFYGATLAILIYTLFVNLEPTRGAIGAFTGGVALLVLSYLVFYLLTSGKTMLKRLAPLVIILPLFIGAAALSLDSVQEQLIKIERSTSWQARDVVWKMSFQAIKERPWLGWGPENFNIPFAKYFDPKLPWSGDLWYDRVHNVFLDTAVHSGILGLLSYLSIFGVAMYGLLKTCSRLAVRINALLPLGMMAVLAVYLAQNIWVFDMISSYLMFFLSLAFVSFLIYAPGPQEESEEVKAKPFLSLLGALLIVLALFSIYFGNIKPAQASHYVVMGVASSPAESIAFFQKALKTSPIALIEGAEQFSRRMEDESFRSNYNKELLLQGFSLAEEALKKAIDQNPQDFRLYLFLGRQYSDLYRLTSNTTDIDSALFYLEKAKELSPRNQQIYWALAQVYLYQGRDKDCVEAMKYSVELDSRFTSATWFLAMSYRAVGENQLALETIKRAEVAGLNWREESDKLKRVIEIHQDLSNDEELSELYPLVLAKEPKNPQLWAGLAVAYANLGQFDKSRQAGEEALKLNPDFADELREFLDQLPK